MYDQSLDSFCNEPAFPMLIEVEHHGKNDITSEATGFNAGLTRLEYFTAQAMSKPDPVQSAKAVLLELWNVRRKGFAESTEILS